MQFIWFNGIAWRLAWALASPLAATTAAAQALDGAVVLSSEQVLRGVAISNGQASLSVDASLRSSNGWGGGIGLATLGRDSAGRRTQVSANLWRSLALDADWSAQLGTAHYAYPGAGSRHRFDYDELSASLGWRGRLTATVTLLPNAVWRDSDGASRRGHAVVYEAGLHQRLSGPLMLDAGIGWLDLPTFRSAGYAYGSVDLSAAVGPAQLIGSFIASGAEARGLVAAGSGGNRWLLSVLWNF